ncbi:hypothetical protein [Saccharolobus caldissimus]|uniref:hypothetical protein n=1 Tax=Saccharolobus caldissimus TaxID=1702097 RepID=UPI001E2E17E3|nr:hypothetical protein [Saccharolobus caldissimus]
MFLLQQSKDRFSVKDFIKIFTVSIPSEGVIVYGKGFELPAYTLERGLSSLRGKIVKISNIFDFLLIQNPYSEIPNVIAFLGNDNELYELVSGLQTLGLNGTIYYCGKTNVKPRSESISINSIDQPLCEINLSLSVLKSLVRNSTEREKRISEELSNFSDLDEWIKEKSKIFDLGLPILLSPIMIPAKSYIQGLGLNVLDYFDMNILSDVQLVYTGADMHTIRKIAFSLRSSGKRVKEILIDVDPLMAPIYLSMILFYLKGIKEV